MEGRPKNSEGRALCVLVLKRSACVLVLIRSATSLSMEGRRKNGVEVLTSRSSCHSCSHKVAAASERRLWLMGGCTKCARKRRYSVRSAGRYSQTRSTSSLPSMSPTRKKHVLRQIQTNRTNLAHGRLLFCG